MLTALFAYLLFISLQIALYTPMGQPRRHAPPLLPSVVKPVNVHAPSALLSYHPDKEFVHCHAQSSFPASEEFIVVTLVMN